MDSRALWKLFTMTGSPEVYLLYREAVRIENG